MRDVVLDEILVAFAAKDEAYAFQKTHGGQLVALQEISRK